MDDANLLETVRTYLIRGNEEFSFFLDEIDAYVTKIGKKTGVFIPCMLDDKFHEKFARVELEYIPTIIFDGKEFSGLYLYMNDRDTNSRLLYEFASICSNFVDPGENGINRTNITTNPLDWWKAWKLIIGNSNSDKMVYSLIGEMMVYHYLLNKGLTYTWTGADKKRVDFVNGINDIEVKSTVKRNGEEITVHGVFQMMLFDNMTLDVMFCRLEENPHGKSINDMIDILVHDGCNRNVIESIVEECGFVDGSSDRNFRYMLLEARKYPVDKDFPRITPASFVNGQIPSGISNLQYKVDLANLKYDKVDIDF